MVAACTRHWRGPLLSAQRVLQPCFGHPPPFVNRAARARSRSLKWFTRPMNSTPPADSGGRDDDGLSDEHLRALGSIVAALGHLDLILLRTVRDLVPGADRNSVEALLAGDSTAQLAEKFDRLVKQHHGDEPICAQVVSWCMALSELWAQWNQEFRSSWVADQPDDALTRVRYTKTSYFGGQPEERTRLDDLEHIAADARARIGELQTMRPRLKLNPR
jgi:hypothetical protein